MSITFQILPSYTGGGGEVALECVQHGPLPRDDIDAARCMRASQPRRDSSAPLAMGVVGGRKRDHHVISVGELRLDVWQPVLMKDSRRD